MEVDIDRIVSIFSKKEKEFTKEQDFVKKMIAAEMYNFLDKKIALKPTHWFYLPGNAPPVTAISREGLSIRGYDKKAPFEWVKKLDTTILMRIFTIVRDTHNGRLEVKRKREEETLKKRNSDKAKRQRKKERKLGR